MASATDLLADENSFHSEYRIFVQALEMLGMEPAQQCAAMGNFNVAWELKDDVAAGKYLVGRGYLDPLQESWIASLAGALYAVPEQVLPAGSEPEANLLAMEHPSWVPLRTIAQHALIVLRPFTDENAKYLGLG